MTRHKITTYERVFQAADQLLANGQRPTQQSVRDALGAGSLTTINKALNDWWQSLGERFVEQRKRPDIPEPVISSADKLWQQALAYAERNLNQQRQSLESQYLQLKADLEERASSNKDEIKRLQDLSDRLLSDSERYLNQCNEYQQALLRQEEREVRLEAENRELTRNIKELEVVLTKMESLQESTVKQSKLDVDHEIIRLEDEYSRLGKHNHTLSQENQNLRAQVVAAEKRAVKDRHGLELVIARQDARYEELQKRLKNDSESLVLTKDSAILASENAVLQAEVKVKEQELERFDYLTDDINKITQPTDK